MRVIVCMCVFTCLYASVFVRLHVCICVSIRMDKCVCACVCEQEYARVRICMPVFLYLQACTSPCTCNYSCTYARAPRPRAPTKVFARLTRFAKGRQTRKGGATACDNEARSGTGNASRVFRPKFNPLHRALLESRVLKFLKIDGDKRDGGSIERTRGREAGSIDR